ncbi:MAG TPA: hypothetical protein VM618_09895 [Acidimicrobiia bacterium]|nr:hypothetical protein [Acidimicrobiia bacterium]
MADPREEITASLKELSDADRAYRAAFRTLTSAAGVTPSSFAALRRSIDRLDAAARRLERTPNA